MEVNLGEILKYSALEGTKKIIEVWNLLVLAGIDLK